MRIVVPLAATNAAKQLVSVAYDPTTRGWGVIFAASVARLGLGFVASIAVARALGPGNFGVYALLGVIGSLIGTAADPGLTAAAMKRIASVWVVEPAVARERSRQFIVLRFGAASAACLAAGAILVPAAPLLGPSLTGALVVLVLLGVVATAASGALNAVLQATASFGRLALVLLVNPALTALLAVLLALAGRLDLVAALVLLGILTSVGATVAAIRLLPFSVDLRATKLATLVDELQALLRYGRWLWLSDLLASLAAQVDVLLLGWLQLGTSTIGTYALALNLASKADVVNHSLYAVALPTASALGDPDSVRRYVRRSLVRSFLIAGGLALLFPLAGPLIARVYGPSYSPAVDLFRGLLAVAMFDVVVTPLLLLAFHYDRPKLLATADAIRVITLVGGAVLLVPVAGAFGAVLARLASRVIGAVVVLVLLHLKRSGVAG